MTKKLRTRSIVACVLGLIALLSYEWSSLVQKAEAIPAFARKYDFKCNVCHVPGFPKLNDFGNLFRDRGYQLGSDADLPTYEGIGMGFWPVSFRTTVGYQAASTRLDGTGASTGGVGFTGLDILSFGTLHRDIAHRIVFNGFQQQQFGLAPGTMDLESAFVKLMRLEKYVGIKSNSGDYLLNLGIGKFELDVPFSEKRSPTLNTQIVMYHYQPGTPYQSGTMTFSPTIASFNTYGNPNTFAIGNNQPGIELTGLKKTSATNGFFRYSLAALTTNTFGGTLAGCPTGQTCSTGGNNFNFYGHMTQSFGGYGIVTGHRIGIFGAYGTAPTTVNGACLNCPGTGGNQQPFSRIGIDLSTTYNGEWNLFGAFMHGWMDKNMFLGQSTTFAPGGVVTNPQDASWNGAFVELDYYPTLLPILGMPDWFFSYRYDVIRNVRQGSSRAPNDYNDVDSHTFLVRYFIHQSTRTDVALHAEYNTYRDKKVGAGGGDLLGQTMLLGVDFAF